MDSKEKLRNALEKMFLNDAWVIVNEEMKKVFNDNEDIFGTEHQIGDRIITVLIQNIDYSISSVPTVKQEILNSKNVDEFIDKYSFLQVTPNENLIVKKIKE